MPDQFIHEVIPQAGDALIVVDLQRDFLPRGAIPVPAGDEVVPIANRYLDEFRACRLPVVFTRDWHPVDHCSFKAQGGPWPVHCVQETVGAKFAPGLTVPSSAYIASKATDPKKDAYSGFAGTDLRMHLHQKHVRRLFVCGVATEYCVLQTVRDALSEGWEVVLLGDGVRAVSPALGRQAIREMYLLGAAIYEPVQPAIPSLESATLLTDLYQLTMMQAYYECGFNELGIFEFFVRDLPPDRNFLISVGLEQVLDYLQHLRFTDEELTWLGGCGKFRRDFVDSLAGFRFTGDVHAMPEGTVFFPQEPILRVTAPLPQAQLVESRLMNLLHFQTLIASKAARSRLAAPGKLLVDFGMRRAHGAEAALLASRASYVAGFDGSATVLAGMRFDIPLYGTMAHSLVLAFDEEAVAFERFAAANPGSVVLLLDTYDTEAAAEKTVALAHRLKSQGIETHGVRLDSGDLAEHARRVRQILDEGGLHQMTIFASGGLDEQKLHELVSSGAPIDGFGVGSCLDVSSDAPYLDCAYKLQEYAGRPRRKQSEGKATWPGAKQVFRRFDGDRMAGDTVTLVGDDQPGEPLLEPVMQQGERLEPRAVSADLRRRIADNLARLPDSLQSLKRAPAFTVEISNSLRRLAQDLDRMDTA